MEASGIELTMHLADLIQESHKRKLLREMRQIQARGNRRVVMVVAGGDGSWGYMLEDAVKEGVNVNEIQFCILPFGTGNDTSQILGWGR